MAHYGWLRSYIKLIQRLTASPHLEATLQPRFVCVPVPTHSRISVMYFWLFSVNRYVLLWPKHWVQRIVSLVINNSFGASHLPWFAASVFFAGVSSRRGKLILDT